jgi:polyhydroxyalkanoate synthesis regulator phasin
METEKLAEQIIDFNRTTFDTSFNAMAMLQEQTEKMLSTSLEQTFWVPNEGRRMIDEWLEAYKRGRDDFKKAVEENFQKIDFGGDEAKGMEEKMTQLHEDINVMGSRLAALEKRDWPQEVVNTLLKKKTLTAKEDLTPLKNTLNDIKKGMPSASELGKIRKSVDQTEAKLNEIAEEMAEIKKLLLDIGPNVKSVPETSEKMVKKAGPRDSSKTA